MRFDFPEYEEAMRVFTRTVAHGFLKAHPIFGQMFSYPTVHAGPVRNVAGPEPVDHPLTSAGGEMTIHFDVIRQTDIEKYLTEFLDVPKMMLTQLEQKFLENVQEITHATGNVHDAGGRAFDFDHFIEAVGRMDVDFDDEGKPILSNLMIIGNFGSAVGIPDPTEEQLRTLEAIVAEKKAEFDAKKRSRRLSE